MTAPDSCITMPVLWAENFLQDSDKRKSALACSEREATPRAEILPSIGQGSVHRDTFDTPAGEASEA